MRTARWIVLAGIAMVGGCANGDGRAGDADSMGTGLTSAGSTSATSGGSGGAGPATSGPGGTDGASGGTDGGGGGSTSGGGILFDVGDPGGGGQDFDLGGGGSGECNPGDLPPTDATLTGTVFAPNMEIPISGALVYLTTGPVEPVPDGLYCAECVELSCDTHYVLTGADGSFTLPAKAGPGQQLVVQKGQFLHVVDFDVAAGTNAVAANKSNLPGSWNPGAGEWIPRIAVYDTYPDKVSNVLAKFGMGQVTSSGNLVRGTENFTLIDDNDEGVFMDDLSGMSQYHIVFIPCAASKYWDIAPTVPADRAQKIRDYVDGGGKWYATDHSNEYIKEPFPAYQDFYSPSMPDIQPAYTVEGSVVDSDMLAWLDALSPTLKDIGGGNPTLNMLPQVELRLNYTGVDATHPVIVQDENGHNVDVGHKTWVEGPCTSCSRDPDLVRPMAISGQYGCGRMMYSTFENSSSAHEGLNPQELVLLYMILEIGVCHSSPPPPPPPQG